MINMAKKNIAVYGGSFNPVHSGHINLVLQLQLKFDFDEIIMIPSKIPPHKPADELASSEHRIKMCEMAARRIGKNCRVSDIEIKSGGVSYTVNTIKKLKSLYPADKLWFIMGSDMLLYFDRWYKYDEILSLASVAAAARDESDKAAIIKKAGELKKEFPCSEIEIINVNILKMSSSDIRNRIKNHEDAAGLLPADVYEYIKSNSLYL